MKKLILLRHAKAEADSTTGHDRDRVLTAGGEKDAARMGKALKKLGDLPERILASPAPRAWQTAERVVEKTGQGALVAFDELYLGEPSVILSTVRVHGSGSCVMVVAHNPGLEELAASLMGGPPTSVHLPTAGMVKLEFAADTWTDIKPGAGLLCWLLTPNVVETL